LTHCGVGNRASEALTSGSTTTNTYNYPSTSNLLSSLTQSSTTVRSFSYDGDGNVTADTRGSTTYNYAYNNRGRLAELTIGSTVTAAYTYDGLERLAIRTTSNMTPAGTTHYVYDLAGHLITEADSSGNILTEYLWLDDMPLALVANVDTSPTLYFVHADHLNRPLRMTDGSESVVWDTVYNPFGDVYSITGSASNNMRFPGQYFLIEDGLHYNWYRQYDPIVGRYTQPDPGREAITATNSDAATFLVAGRATGYWELAQTAMMPTNLNRHIGVDLPEFVDGPSIFAYVRSTPLMNVDPRGLQSRPFTPRPPLDSCILTIQPCGVAFNLCMQSSAGNPHWCQGALQACLNTGLLTIFPGGIVGQRGG
jgi:RHS repeat-associated protein